jgi:hypothetical protein
MVSTSVLGISVCTAAMFFFWRQLEQSLVLTETYCSLDDGRTEFSDSKVLGGVWPVGRQWLKYRGIPESSITWIGTDHPIGAPVACLASQREAQPPPLRLPRQDETRTCTNSLPRISFRSYRPSSFFFPFPFPFASCSLLFDSLSQHSRRHAAMDDLLIKSFALV